MHTSRSGAIQTNSASSKQQQQQQQPHQVPQKGKGENDVE